MKDLSTGEPDAVDIPWVWDRLNDGFLELYGAVIRNTATVRWQAAASDNAYHHLMAYAEFDRVGCPEEEDLVISVSVAKSPGRGNWVADAGQSAGLVLHDGVERFAPDTDPLSRWIGEALADTLEWIRAETPNFIAYLNQEPTPYDVD